MPKTELYVGNLNKDVTRKDIESVFDKYGRLVRCDLKNRGFGSIYAFLEFEKFEDAEDALKTENGKDMCGSSMSVEWAKAKTDRRDRDRFSGRNSFRSNDRDRRTLECYECGERGHFARDCKNRRGSGRDRRDRPRDSSRSRRHGSRDRRDRDRRRSRSKTRSRSNRRTKTRSRTRSRSRSISHDRSKKSH